MPIRFRNSRAGQGTSAAQVASHHHQHQTHQQSLKPAVFWPDFPSSGLSPGSPAERLCCCVASQPKKLFSWTAGQVGIGVWWHMGTWHGLYNFPVAWIDLRPISQLPSCMNRHETNFIPRCEKSKHDIIVCIVIAETGPTKVPTAPVEVASLRRQRENSIKSFWLGSHLDWEVIFDWEVIVIWLGSHLWLGSQASCDDLTSVWLQVGQPSEENIYHLLHQRETNWSRPVPWSSTTRFALFYWWKWKTNHSTRQPSITKASVSAPHRNRSHTHQPGPAQQNNKDLFNLGSKKWDDSEWNKLQHHDTEWLLLTSNFFAASQLCLFCLHVPASLLSQQWQPSEWLLKIRAVFGKVAPKSDRSGSIVFQKHMAY